MVTERTRIIPLQYEDFDEVIEMYHEPDSNKFIQPLQGKSDAFYRTFLARKIEANKTVSQFWTVRELSGNQFVGTLNLNQFSDTDMTHIGCHLAVDFWNKGYGKELMKRIIKFGFEERELESIHAVIDTQHEVSLKLFNNLGFKFFENRELEGVQLNILRLEKKQLNTTY